MNSRPFDTKEVLKNLQRITRGVLNSKIELAKHQITTKQLRSSNVEARQCEIDQLIDASNKSINGTNMPLSPLDFFTDGNTGLTSPYNLSFLRSPELQMPSFQMEPEMS